jgi:hypothetical protein
MSEEGLDFTCDNCGRDFVPEEGCYIGPKDRRSMECCMSVFTMEPWENLCTECNQGEKNEG